MNPQPQTQKVTIVHCSALNYCTRTLALLLLTSCLAGWAQGAQENSCKTTSSAALRACRFEAQSDYQLALGKCANLSAPAARKVCRLQARTNYLDALASCRDQFVARQKVCDRLGGAPYDPVINPSNFLSTVTNEFFPLAP